MSLAACVRRWPSTTRWPLFANSLRPRNGSSTDGCASLNWRNSGSWSSRPSMRQIQARVPTLPTPDHLAGRVDVAEALEQLAPVARERAPVRADDAAEELLDLRRRARRGHPRSARSAAGRRRSASSPSTTSVSLPNAFMLSFVRPLATFASGRSRPWRPSASPPGLNAREQIVDVDAASTRCRGCASRRTRGCSRGTTRPTSWLIVGALLLVEAAIAPGDGEAGDEPFDVPLERAGERLVEVVEAEDELAGRARRSRRSSTGGHRRRAGCGARSAGRPPDPTPSGRRRRDRT